MIFNGNSTGQFKIEVLVTHINLVYYQVSVTGVGNRQFQPFGSSDKHALKIKFLGINTDDTLNPGTGDRI